MTQINTHLAWMCDCQCGYVDEQIKFWLLLHLLMDGSEVTTWQTGMLAFVYMALVFCHPSNVVPTCPNQHGNRNGLLLNQKGEKQDLWTEAYACSLQGIAEATAGWSWISEGEGWSHRSAPCSCNSGSHQEACEPRAYVMLATRHSIVPKVPRDEICVM